MASLQPLTFHLRKVEASKQAVPLAMMHAERIPDVTKRAMLWQRASCM